MSRAEANLKAAQQAGAADADPVDLEFARGKYQQAQQALEQGKNALAASRAQESLADSGLALTKARLASMRAKVEAQRKENQRLRRQLLEHAATNTPPASASSSVEELPQTVLPTPAPAASAPSSTQPTSTDGSMQEGQ